MSERPFVVAVAGGTCSGKSTLVQGINRAFRDAYSVTLLSMDSYFKKDPPRTIGPITGAEYAEHNHPDTLRIDTLLADYQSALTGDSDLIVVEGLFALRMAEVREAADIKVFVDLASDARLVRRIERHMGYGQTFEEITGMYLDTVRFRHDELIEPTRWYADVIVNGTLDIHRGLEVLIAYIASLL